MVLTPSEATFDGLRAVMNSGGANGGSFDGGDQGVLNQWFSGDAGSGPRWNQLSFTYNVTPTAAYTYAPAYAHYGASISVVHFIGRAKPWHTLAYGAPHSATNAYNDPARPYHYDALVGRWWSVYNRWVAPRLRVDGGSVAAAPKRLSGGLAGKEGGFVGLALDGREDLIPPSRRPAVSEEPEAVPSPSPPARQPSPEYRPQELQKGVPYFLPWDPATQDPPKTGAQMSGAFPTTDYSADWASKAANRPAGAGDWVPDVPERLRHGRTEREEAQSAVFPWENQSRPAPTRVFPGEARRVKPATTKIGAPRPDLPSPAQHPASSTAPAPGVKQSFAQAMAGPSTNAWDADPAIQAYASLLTSPPIQPPAAHQSRGETGRGSRGGDGNRSREQSRDGGADGDDEESTGGDDSDDEAEDDGGEGDRVVMRFRRDGPGGGAGAAGGGGNGVFEGLRPVTFSGASNTSAGGGGGGNSQSRGASGQQHQTQHHTSAEHHAMHSRAVQASTEVRNASTQYSPVARTVPLPQPTSAGLSTPPLESSRTATSAENSVLHTPSSQQPQQQQRAPAIAPPNGGGGASAAFNARFGFDSLGPNKTSQQPSQTKVKTAGRTWGASLAILTPAPFDC